MRVQRFVGKDMKSALLQIKEQIGYDALILGDRTVPGGIEVLVDISDVIQPKGNIRSKKEIKPQDKKRYKIPMNESSPRYDSNKMEVVKIKPNEPKNQTISEPDLDDIASKHELDILRNDFTAFASKMNQQLKELRRDGHEVEDSIVEANYRRIEQKGFSSTVIDSILKNIGTVASVQRFWEHCSLSLTQRLKTISMEPLQNVHVFLGPAGGGKTTTIAKLATKTVMEFGPESVALLSADRLRMGAFDQLRMLSNDLGVSLGVIDENASFRHWITALSHKRLVLVDTAGLHPSSKKWEYHINQMVLHLDGLHERPVYAHLVLPATGEQDFIQQSIHNYAELKPDSVVMTKIDEAMLLGPILSCLLLHNMPVSWFCDGQAVPKNIHRAKSQLLMSKALTQDPVWPQDGMPRLRARSIAKTGRIEESVE